MNLTHLTVVTLVGVAGGYLTISDLFAVQMTWLLARRDNATDAALNLPAGRRRKVAIVAAKFLQGLCCPVCFGWWSAAVGVVVWRWAGVELDHLQAGDLFVLWLAAAAAHTLVTGTATRTDIL